MRAVLKLILVVRAETPAFVAEAGVWQAGWWHRYWKTREGHGLRRIRDVDHGHVVKRSHAIVDDRFRVHVEKLALEVGRHGMHVEPVALLELHSLDELGLGDVADVKDDQAGVAIRKVNQV